MRVRLSIIALIFFGLAACGGGVGPPAPAGLGYSVPNPAAVTYMTADTSYIEIDAMGQMMQMSTAQSATVNAVFADVAGAVQVTLTYEDFGARLTQPMGAPMTADESGIKGPLVYSVDRTGNVTVGSVPDVTGNASTLFAPLSTMQAFLPGLPGMGVGVGDMWTDTVSYSGDEGPGTISAITISEYSVVGDVTVDGRSMLRIDITGSSVSETEASVEGMDVFQSMSAMMEGHMLWDMQAGVMHERVLTFEGDGTTEVSAAPMAMSMQMNGTSTTRRIN